MPNDILFGFDWGSENCVSLGPFTLIIKLFTNGWIILIKHLIGSFYQLNHFGKQKSALFSEECTISKQYFHSKNFCCRWKCGWYIMYFISIVTSFQLELNKCEMSCEYVLFSHFAFSSSNQQYDRISLCNFNEIHCFFFVCCSCRYQLAHFLYFLLHFFFQLSLYDNELAELCSYGNVSVRNLVYHSCFSRLRPLADWSATSFVLVI